MTLIEVYTCRILGFMIMYGERIMELRLDLRLPLGLGLRRATKLG